MNDRTKAPRPGGLLVPDVVQIILQYLLIDDQGDSREYGLRRKSLRQAMCNYALVGRGWRLPVQRILFSEVNISTRYKLKKMEDIMPVYTGQGRFLRGCVRSLRLWILDPEIVNSLQAEDIPSIMCQFPSLYELRLDTQNLSSFSIAVMRDFRKTPSIQALMLTRNALKEKADRKINDTEAIEFDLQLLCKVPHWKLRRFVLGRGLQVHCRISPSPPHQLEEFRFHGQFKGGWQREALSGGISWYLRNSMETLQVFSTTCSFYDPSMLRLGVNNNKIQSAEFLHIYPHSFPFDTFRCLRELMWLTIGYSWKPHELLPVNALSQMNHIIHLGFLFQPAYDWNWHFGRDIMGPQNARNPPNRPPALPYNVRRISFIGYSSNRYPRRSVQERIQKQLGNDIEVRLYCSLREYKESMPLKLIPRDYEAPSSPQTDEYSMMTRLVNQADERSGQHSASVRISRAKAKPPAKKLPWK
ncbi:hypothetical protein CPB86DRAFT_791347 [Serendipita vermifera]|nr:hypothetical protein CPB86DRAFT_791347 [Serendipita vermifera]